MLGVAVKLALAGRVRAVLHVEREAAAAATLVARMDDAALDRAPIWDDVETASSPEVVGYLRRFDNLIVCGGYPCQPFSNAGKRAGVDDERHLWRHIDRFVGEVKPGVCFFENVPGHLGLGFAEVRRNLEERGYRVAAGIYSSGEVGAPHDRERLYILAVGDAKHPERRSPSVGGALCNAGEVLLQQEDGSETPDRVGTTDGRLSQVADANGVRRQQPEGGELGGGRRAGHFGEGMVDHYPPHRNHHEAWKGLFQTCKARIEPALPRLASGVAAGLDADRLRISGNGVDPLVAAYAFTSLASSIVGHW